MNLKIMRVKLGLTQRQLSTKANVNIKVISKIESGDIKSVRVSSLFKLAAAFNKTVAELFFYDIKSNVGVI